MNVTSDLCIYDNVVLTLHEIDYTYVYIESDNVGSKNTLGELYFNDYLECYFMKQYRTTFVFYSSFTEF